MPAHLFKICAREKRYTSIAGKTKYLEDLLVVTAVGYIIYRLIGFDRSRDFYLKETSHPHVSVRILNVIIRLVESTAQNTELPISKTRVIDCSMLLLEFYASSMDELNSLVNFLEEGKVNLKSIRDYIFELQELVVNSPETAFYKSQKKANENI